MKWPYPICPACGGPGTWTPGPRGPLKGWWVCALCRRRWSRNNPPEYLRMKAARAGPDLFDDEKEG